MIIPRYNDIPPNNYVQPSRDSQHNHTTPQKIPVIITSENESLNSVINVCKQDFDITPQERLEIINGFTANLTQNQLQQLQRSLPRGYHVTIDTTIPAPQPVLPDPAGNRLDLDNAIDTLGLRELWKRGYKGQGTTIAVIDTGIYPHPDLKDRIIAFKDWVAGKNVPYDDQGHGTHVAGDAAGNGRASGGKYTGAAPEANLIGIKVLGPHGGRMSDIIKGIQWAIDHKNDYHIDIINMSLGGPAMTSYRFDPVDKAVEQAVKSGVVTLVAAGNSGPKPSTIGTPGNDPKAFTVGALDDKGTLERDDDEVAFFSSRGPTAVDGLTKPDILVPGVRITAPLAPDSQVDHLPLPHVGASYITLSGTSMATPIMAGIVAILLSANPDLSPEQVKSLFMETAIPLKGIDQNTQGAGIVNPRLALERALEMKKSVK